MKQPPYKYMVRLPVPMRDLIAESARHYRRSMNSDIVARLQHSFSGLGDQSAPTQFADEIGNETAADFTASRGDSARHGLAPPLHDQFEALFRRDLSEQEEQLIRSFRRLSATKRESLLALLS
jgi:hypothetical protein